MAGQQVSAVSVEHPDSRPSPSMATEGVMNDDQTRVVEDTALELPAGPGPTDGNDNSAIRLATAGNPPNSIRQQPSRDQATLEKTSSDNSSTNTFAKVKERVKITAADVLGRSSSNENLHSEARPWKKTYFRLGPLFGLLGILLAAASIIAALGILVGSNGEPKAKWSVGPSTYLAILVAIANNAMRFSAWNGAIIAFWIQASQGTTLERLHHNWQSGMTLRGALIAGRHLRLVGLACIASTLVVADGPLLQKATTIVSTQINDELVSLNFTMTQELPRYWSGGWLRTPGYGAWVKAFNDTMPTSNGTTPTDITPFVLTQYQANLNWFRNKPLINTVSGCPATCKTTIRAPALAVTSCRSEIIPVNYNQTVDSSGYLKSLNALPLNTLAFIVQPELMLGNYETIDLVTGYVETNNCAGALNLTSCTLESAIGDYDVTISNGILTMDAGKPKIVALANNTQVADILGPSSVYSSTLAGIVAQLSIEYRVSVNIFLDEGAPRAETTYNAAYADEFLNFDADTQYCPSYTDPREDVLQKMNGMMFTAGGYAAQWAQDQTQDEFINTMDPDLPVNRTVIGYVQGTHETFETNLRWFAAALAVELACIALVLPTYWGWWKLGRPVSFSPLEIAKAFEAPMLAGSSSNSSGADIAKAASKGRIRYGETTDDGNERQILAFAAQDSVRAPQDGVQYA